MLGGTLSVVTVVEGISASRMCMEGSAGQGDQFSSLWVVIGVSPSRPSKPPSREGVGA